MCDDNNNDIKHSKRYYFVPYIVLNTFHALTNLNLTTTLCVCIIIIAAL